MANANKSVLLLCTTLLLIAIQIAIQIRPCYSGSGPIADMIESAGNADDYPGSNTLIIFDSTITDVKESGLSYVRMHKLTKILTTAGAKNHRLLKFGYDPLSAKVEIGSIIIYRKNGGTDTIKKDKFYDYPAPARMIYWGARELAVELGRLQPGDAVETIVNRKGFTYALLADDDDKFIPPMRGHYYDIVHFYSGEPVLEKVYKIYMPPDKPLQYEVYNGEVQSYVHFGATKVNGLRVRINPQEKEIKSDHILTAANAYEKTNKIIYCWTKKDIMPFKHEPNMVSGSDVETKLLLSTAADWWEKAAWFNGVNEDFGSFNVTPEVQEKTDELLGGVDDEMEKIKILTHWAAEEIRYSGISMGEGEGYTLHKGQMTFADRCGVCKDKAGMLVTMLRAAGFKSYPAMTMAGSRIDRIPADQFNHSVTVAQLSSGDWILLDPTWVPGVRELWSSAEQQQQFLMGIPGGADLMTTPVSPAENHYLKIVGKSKIVSGGALMGFINITAEGQTDALIRRAFLRNHKSARKEYFQKLFAKIAPDVTFNRLNYTDPEDISRPFSIEIWYEIPHYATITNDKIIFTPLLAKNPFDDYFMSPELSMNTDKEEKEYGFRTRSSKIVEITETIVLQSPKHPVEIPKFNEIDSEAAKFKAQYNNKGGKITLSATHVMGKRIYEAGDWPDFRAALIQRKELMKAPLVFMK